LSLTQILAEKTVFVQALLMNRSMTLRRKDRERKGTQDDGMTYVNISIPVPYSKKRSE
jgi:hypothetical protein